MKTAFINLIKRIPWLKQSLLFVYYTFFRVPYGKAQVRLVIGGMESLELDYSFGHHHYDEFGGNRLGYVSYNEEGQKSDPLEFAEYILHPENPIQSETPVHG